MRPGIKTIAAIFFLFCAAMLLYQVFKNTELRYVLLKRGKLASAKIYRIGPEGSKFKNSVCYRFQVGQQTFEDCEQYHLSGSLQVRLVGINVPVIYDSTHPGVNRILLYKDDFQSYHLSYPDRLHWIEALR